MNAIIMPRASESDFLQALDRVLRHEGGYVNHRNDPGGATNFGISLRLLRDMGDLDGDGYLDGDLDRDGDVDADDIRQLDRATAARIYRSQWWDRYDYAELPFVVGAKVFDLAVNMGAHQAHLCLQRGIRAVTRMAIAEDGKLGPITRGMARHCPEVQLAIALRSEAAGFYRQLPIRNPKLADFLKGWLARAYD